MRHAKHAPATLIAIVVSSIFYVHIKFNFIDAAPSRCGVSKSIKSSLL